MEGIEKIRKQLQCPKCHFSYNQKVAYYHAYCGHHTCWDCLRSVSNDDSRCPVCFRENESTYVPFLGDVLNNLKSCETSILKSDEVEKELRNEIEKLKQKQILLEAPPDRYNCIECDKLYPDQEMQLCETCHELKFEDHEDVRKNALCAVCAIKKHMRKGHQTVDFFPYFRAYNLSSRTPKINANSDEFRNARNLLNDTLTRFNASSIDVSGNYDLLTDMARRSKNTKNQLEFFEKMEKFIDKSKSIHGVADSDMKNHTKSLEETLTELKEWYESRMEDCVDESEIIKLTTSDGSAKGDMVVD